MSVCVNLSSHFTNAPACSSLGALQMKMEPARPAGRRRKGMDNELGDGRLSWRDIISPAPFCHSFATLLLLFKTPTAGKDLSLKREPAYPALAKLAGWLAGYLRSSSNTCSRS